VIGDSKHPPTPEQIQANWGHINTMDGAKTHWNLTAALMDLMTPVQ